MTQTEKHSGAQNNSGQSTGIQAMNETAETQSVCNRHEQPMLADRQLVTGPVPVRQLNCKNDFLQSHFEYLHSDH